MSRIIWNCQSRLYLDTEERGTSVLCWQGWGHSWHVPEAAAGVKLIISIDARTTPQTGHEFDPILPGYIGIFKGDDVILKAYKVESKYWHVFCDVHGPFNEGDWINVRFCPDGSGDWFLWGANFQVCYEIGECPEVIPEQLPFMGYCPVFGRVADSFDDIVEAVEDYAVGCEGWWIIGPDVAATVRVFKEPFIWVRDRFELLEDWCGYLCTYVNDLDIVGVTETWITDTFAILSWGPQQFVDWIADTLKATFDILGKSASEVVAWISGSLESSYDILTESVSGLAASIADTFESSYEWFFKSTDDFKAWLFGTFEDGIDWFFKSTDDFKAWLFGTFEDRIEWFFVHTDDFKAWLFGTFEGSIEWFFKSSDDFIKYIQDHLPPVPTPESIVEWLGDTIGDLVEAGLNFVGEEVDRFKDLIWDTVEKVLKKL